MVKQLAGSAHELVIHDMHKREIAERAKQQGIHRVPVVVIDGKVAEFLRKQKGRWKSPLSFTEEGLTTILN
jgi:glutaredoxin